MWKYDAKSCKKFLKFSMKVSTLKHSMKKSFSFRELEEKEKKIKSLQSTAFYS